ncbi:glycosyl transferase family 1 [Oceanispirochaeta crateris]|uniref:Glycosyl transferase family 1 n=1 Tax=Oceanispirochaeta crateris TaxID=2518645 RepID=A0A5C1QN40_9SPIO|nr:glycosyltransferase [Oceanispirochaeta crateris]QEN08380.1 glycosyl transferase family 1 [Oceanispirochaeta crateris]
MNQKYKLAFVCGKLGDVDGVSLEVDKWIEVLGSLGHEVYAIAGSFASDLPMVPEQKRLEVPELCFDSDFQKNIELLMFPHIIPGNRSNLSEHNRKELLEDLDLKGAEAADTIHRFLLDNKIDCLIAQNTNAMPMTLIGGSAVYKLASEYKMSVIFHHHDFWWERSRFSGNHMEDLLKEIMPPDDPSLEHVVISSYAAHNLRTIKRVNPHIVPNCEDFDHPPVKDEYNSTFRMDLGFKEDDILFLQPTRIVPRKRIEDSILLVSQFQMKYPELKERIRFVISLYQGDELDDSYVTGIQSLAESVGVHLDLIADRVASIRGVDAQGRKLYTNRDVLVNSDIVTYLPIWEGFGNALLETVAARVPLIVATYLVYKTDIMNRGLECVEIRDDYDEKGNLIIPENCLGQIYQFIQDPGVRAIRTENSFNAMKKAFGMPVLEKKLESILGAYGDEILASRRRLSKSNTTFAV